MSTPLNSGLTHQKQASLTAASQLKQALLGARKSSTEVYGDLHSSEELVPNRSTMPTYTPSEAALAISNASQEYSQQYRERNENSWVKDTERGTLTGMLAQGAGTVGKELTRLGGSAAAIPHSLETLKWELAVDDQTKALRAKERAYEEGLNTLKADREAVKNEYIDGKINRATFEGNMLAYDQQEASLQPLTEEEQTYYNSPLTRAEGSINKSSINISRKEAMLRAETASDTAAKIKNSAAEFADNLFKLNPLSSEYLAMDFADTMAENDGYFTAAGDAWAGGDKLKAIKEVSLGIANVAASGLGDLGDNPLATYEIVAQMAPQVLLAMTSSPAFAATQIGYGADIFEKSVRTFREETGQDPTQAQLIPMLAASIAAPAADTIVDRGLAAAFSKGKGAGSVLDELLANPIKGKTPNTPDVDEEVSPKEASRNIGSILFDKAKVATEASKPIINNGITRTGATAVKGGLSEAVTEGGQNYLEDNVALGDYALDTPEERARVGFNALAGFAGGTSIGGVGRGLGELAGATPEKAKAREDSLAAASERKGQVQAAIKSGDISAWTDEKKPEYSQAVAILAERQKSTEIPDDVKAAERTEIDNLRDKAKGKVDDLNKELALSSPEQIKRFEADFVESQARLKENNYAQYEGQENAPTAQRDQARVNAIPDLIAKAKGARKQRKKWEKELTVAQNTLQTIDDQIKGFTTQDVAAKVESGELEATITKAETAETPEERTTAAAQLFKTIVDSPAATAWNDETINRLVDNPDNGFDEDQRTYLRAFSTERTARNLLQDAKGVNDLVLKGKGKAANEDNGLDYYSDTVKQALGKRQWDVADKALGWLTGFATDHRMKSQKLNEGLELATQTGKPQYLVRQKDPESPWLLTDVEPEGWNVKDENGVTGRDKNGGLEIRKGFSNNQAGVIEQEADLIEARLSQLNVAQKLARKTPEPAAPVVETPVENTVNGASEEVDVPWEESTQEPPTETEVAPDLGLPPESVQEAQVEPELTAQPEITNEYDDYFSGSDSPINNEANESLADNDFEGDMAEAVEASDARLEELFDPAIEANTEEETVVLDDGALPSQEVIEGRDRPSAEMNAGEYTSSNLATALFDQDEGKGDTSTKRPLVLIQDFISNTRKVSGLFLEFLNEPKEGFRAPQAVQRHLAQFMEFHAKNLENVYSISRSLAAGKKSKAYRFEDMAQFLNIRNVADDLGNITEQPVDVENLATAIMYAGFSWLGKRGDTAFRTENEVKRQFGMLDSDFLSPAAFSELTGKGTREGLVTTEMGRMVMDALGLKPRKGASSDAILRMEQSLGLRAQLLLMKGGHIKREQVDVPKELLGEGMPAKQPFIAVIRDPETGVITNPETREIVEGFANTQDALDRLFNPDTLVTHPTDAPVTVNENVTTKGTKQNVPAYLRKAGQALNNAGLVEETDVNTVLEALTDNVLNVATGQVDPESVPKALREKTRAKNEGNQRQISDWREFLANRGDKQSKPFFLEVEFWKQQRVGYKQSKVNPQQNKLQRPLMSFAEHATSVKPSELNSTANRSFRLAVAQAFGISTDKQRINKSLGQLDTLLESEATIAAIDAVTKLLAGEQLSAEQQQPIADFISKNNGEEMHSLRGLVEMAKYLNTPEGSSFTTRMMYEIDGVTNGPALAHMMLGILPPGLANSVGVYFKGSKHRNFTSYKENTENRDMYQNLMSSIGSALQSAVAADSNFAGLVNNVLAISGPLIDEVGNVTSAGRTLVKQPLTSLIFGAGLNGVVANMSANFIDNVYEAMTAAAKSTDPKASFKELETALNAIFKAYGVKGAPVNFSSQGRAFNTVFTPDQQAAIQTAFSETIGEQVKVALKSQFKEFLDKRQGLNRAAQYMWGMYTEAYNRAYAAKLKELVEAGVVAADAKGNPLKELPPSAIAEIEARLEKAFPLVHTAMSQMDRNTKAGLLSIKTKRGFTTATDAKNRGAASLDVEIPDNAGGTIKSFTQRPRVRKMEDPGVGMVIMLVHALDSAIAAGTYSEFTGLNMHDAIGFSMKDVFTGAKAFNQNTFNRVLEYSLPMAIAGGLQRSYNEAARLEASDPMFAGLLDAVNKDFMRKDYQIGLKYPVPFEQFYWEMRQDAINMEGAKLDSLANTAHWNQYAMDEGEYTLEPDDYKTIKSKQQALEKAQKALNEERKAHRTKTWTKEPDTKPTKPSVGNKPNPAVTNIPTKDVSSLVPDLELEKDLLALPDEITFADAYAAVEKSIRSIKNQSTRQAKLVLLKRLKGAVNPELRIKIDHSGKPPVNVPPTFNENDTTYSAWFDPYQEGPDYIVLRTSEYHPQFNGMNPETVLHELLHAAFFSAINNERRLKEADPSYTSPTLEAVEQLDALLVDARAFAIKHGVQDNYGNAFDNVHELISWGMTSKLFQREILAKLQPTDKSKYKGNMGRVFNGLEVFVKNLMNILYQGSPRTQDDKLNSALTSLIIHTDTLFNSVKMPPADTGGLATNRQPAPMSMKKETDYHSAEEIFDALQDPDKVLDPVHAAHLKQVMNRVVETIHGKFGVLQAGITPGATAGDTFLQTLNAKEVPFTTAAQTTLGLSNQELFVLESAELAMRGAIEASPSIYTELQMIHRDAAKEIQPTDLDSDPVKGKKLHDFLFRPHVSDSTKSEYITRFAAAALVYKPLLDKLGDVQVGADVLVEGNGLGPRLQRFFNKAIQVLRQFINGTVNTSNANQKVKILAQRLAQIQAKNASTNKSAINELSEAAEKGLQSFSEGVRDKIIKVVESDALMKSGKPVITFPARVASMIAREEVGQVMDYLQQLRDRKYKEKQGVLAALATEVRGQQWELQQLLMLANNHQTDRRRLKEEMAKFIKGSFKSLTEEQSKSFTKVVLKLDLASLSGTYSMDSMDALMRDSNYRLREIKRIENHIRTLNPKLAEYYLSQAHALGYMMVKGEAKTAIQSLNAHNIANLNGIKGQSVSATDAAKAVDSIEQLASLYGLHHSDKTDLNNALSVLRDERTRPAGEMNGFEVTMQLQSALKKQSNQDLFDNNPVLQQKGYIKSIFSPHVQITMGSELDAPLMEKAGYRRIGTLKQDPNDPSDTQVMFVQRGGGISPRLTGIMSLSGMRSAGTSIHSGLSTVAPDGSVQVHGANKRLQQRLDQAKQREMAGWFNGTKKAASFNPAKVSDNYAVPTFNAAGQIANYRYLMSEETQATYLDPNLSVDQVMGATAASILDKAGSQEMNMDAMDELLKQYQAEVTYRPESYLDVSPESKDPTLREAWNLLPESTKEHIRKTWGRNGMYVRTDQLNMVFGYRKFSLADAASARIKSRAEALKKGRVDEDEPYALRTQAEHEEEVRAVRDQIMDGILKGLGWGDIGRGVGVLRAGENGWQEIVRETKNIIVIKNLTTLAGNMTSNISFLMMAGVPLHKIVSGHITAMMGAIKYGRDQRTLNQLEIMARVRPNDIKLQDEIVKVRDSLARNPIKELADVGMLQTIAEDLDAVDDAYSYKSRLTKWVDGKTEWANGTLKDTAKFAYMSQDTPVYKFLNQATHLSDFMGRYTLVEHLTTRKNKPMSPEAAYERAMDMFVNYDIPSHVGLQYLNDMGLLWFTKYYLRVQKALLVTMRENTGRSIAINVLDSMIPGLSTIVDSGFWGRMTYLPTGWGALEYPMALDELATWKGITGNW